MTKARALWTIAPGQAELRSETLPAPAPDQVLARMLASGISRGTERLVLAGKVPENQWGVMRCPLQAGDFPFPVKYGYSGVARVAEGPAELRGRIAPRRCGTIRRGFRRPGSRPDGPGIDHPRQRQSRRATPGLAMCRV